MSGTGTGSRTGKRKSAGVKSGKLLTEAKAAKALGISRERMARVVRIGLVFSFWSRGQRYVVLP